MALDDVAANSEASGAYADSVRQYEAARELMRRGSFSEAASLFRSSFELHPHFKASELLGECHLNLGEFTKAVMPLAAATALNRGFRAPYLLARVWKEMGEIENAREMAMLALDRKPDANRAKKLLQELDALMDSERPRGQ